MGKRERADASSLKLNLTDPCRTCSTVPVPRLRDASPAGWVKCFSICACTMPRDQNRTAKGSILKENQLLCPSGYIIYLCLYLILTLQYMLAKYEYSYTFLRGGGSLNPSEPFKALSIFLF